MLITIKNNELAVEIPALLKRYMIATLALL
jgi:hypothetical protein